MSVGWLYINPAVKWIVITRLFRRVRLTHLRAAHTLPPGEKLAKQINLIAGLIAYHFAEQSLNE
ncbi:MAG: hypothetical protein ACOY4D_12530 [Pseudomonadota bacterium]